jgi:D-alanyl-D-alanine carboxypeptidase/D-alanyl-D-alanine-endopeptidase (penicillin-binding protein 4)
MRFAHAAALAATSLPENRNWKGSRCMRPFRRTLVVVFLLLVPAAPARAEHDLASDLEAVLGRPEYAGARWGVLVADEAGKPLYRRHAGESFLPASTIKLYFGAAALADLGADYRFETPVYARGQLVQGRLHGDLILVASGDPTLGGRDDGHGGMAYTDDDHTYANASGSRSRLTPTDPLAGLKDLARQVARAGVRRVEGDVLIDDRLFETTRGSGNGPLWLSPAVVNDNLIDIEIDPAARVGDLARVQLRPETDLVSWENGVVTVEAGQPTQLELESRGPWQFSVRGQVARDAGRLLRVYAVPDPAVFARGLFIDCLRREGVEVAADAHQAPVSELPPRGAYTGHDRLAVFRSLPFAQLLKVTLKVSSNLYANTFPLLIAAHHGERTRAEGLRRQRHILTDLGADLGQVSLATASGGSADDRLTPEAVVQLLTVLRRRADYPVFRAALPVLGKDGTLADVGVDSPACGRVRAKTGTFYIPPMAGRNGLLVCKGLAGTLTTARGRTLLFAFFVNDVRLPPGVTSAREGRVLGQLCTILYRDGP